MAKNLSLLKLVLAWLFLLLSIALFFTGFPVMAAALVLGLSWQIAFRETFAINLSKFKITNFCKDRLLKFGVALMGLQISFNQLNLLGYKVVLFVFLSLFITIVLGFLISYLFKLNFAGSILVAASTSICGSSAALAISSCLPNFSYKNQTKEELTVATVVLITAVSSIVMLVYPALAQDWQFFNQLNLNAADSLGIFLGASIHNVAQVVGAGYSVNSQVGEVATYVKLLKVSFLPLVMLGLCFFSLKSSMSGGETKAKNLTAKSKYLLAYKQIPWFVIGFFVLLMFNNLWTLSDNLVLISEQTSKIFIVLSLIAVGTQTNLISLLKNSKKVLGLILINTLILTLLSLYLMKLIF